MNRKLFRKMSILEIINILYEIWGGDTPIFALEKEG